MTTTASSIAGEVAILRQQVQTIHGIAGTNVEGITHEESMIQPRPAGNCLNWVMGHMVWAYDMILPMLGQAPVMEEETLKPYSRGSEPLEDSASALDLADLMTAWDESTERIIAGIAGVSAETLDGPAPFSPTDDPDETVRSLLTGIVFHQAYYAGQTGLLRRIVGKEGAFG